MIRNGYRLFFVAAVFIALGVGSSLGLQSLRVTRSFSVSAAGHRMPQVDRELEAWLKTQPGVIPASVLVRRNHHYNLNVSLDMKQTVFGVPEFPDVDTQCAKMGYRFKTDRFIDDPTFE
ncbi:MAG: hypothetical protein AAGG48_25660 [Planctomycetota bacterium]